MSRKYEYVKLPSATIHIREARATIKRRGLKLAGTRGQIYYYRLVETK